LDIKKDKTDISFIAEGIDFKLENGIDLAKWLIAIGQEENRSIALLEYILCSDEYLLAINKEYLDHDYYTDIITFPLQDSPLEATIFISIDRVRENAELYKNSFTDELHRVIVHGLLHLLGYKDKTDEEKSTMRSKEDESLSHRTFL